MCSFNQSAIKRKAGLLNLAVELAHPVQARIQAKKDCPLFLGNLSFCFFALPVKSSLPDVFASSCSVMVKNLNLKNNIVKKYYKIWNELRSRFRPDARAKSRKQSPKVYGFSEKIKGKVRAHERFARRWLQGFLVTFIRSQDERAELKEITAHGEHGSQKVLADHSR